MIRLSGIVLGVVLAGLPAHAERPASSAERTRTPAEIAREAGLLGQWAEDCSRPPSDDNPHSTYTAMPNGQIENRWYTDFGVFVRRRLLSIQSAGANLYDLRILDSAHGDLRATIAIRGNRKHTMTMSARGMDLVKDNRDLDTGELILPDDKCEATLSERSMRRSQLL